ncbi:MAG: type III-A CRISPR-associated RAMP protein Csm5 [Bacteroidota bacterium]
MNREACIPGSSLKGSIRTAILNYLIRERPNFVKREKHLGRERNGKMQYQDARIQANYLAPSNGQNHRLDPQKDFLRLLHIGDAHFKTSTELRKSMVINEYRNGWDEKKQLSSLFVCIPQGQKTHFSITIPEDLLRHTRAKKHLQVPENFPALNLSKLLQVVNDHSLLLLKEEIEFWEEEEHPLVLEGYIDYLQEIQEIAKAGTDGAAVLRVGAGTGWDFMTGGWPKRKDKYKEFLLEDRTWNDLKRSMRRGNYDPQTPFPKTRKLIQGGVPFGFIKIAL